MTLELGHLSLTLSQINEINELDSSFVDAWLKAAEAPDVRSPTGFFLSGLRSGEYPGVESIDRRVPLAERWVMRVGLLYDRESDVLDELFNERGLLRDLADDVQLRDRLLALWASYRPVGEAVEAAAIERGHRLGAAYHAMKDAEIAERRGTKEVEHGS